MRERCSRPDNGFVQLAFLGALPACPNGSEASIRRTLSWSAMRAVSAVIADISDQQLRAKCRSARHAASGPTETSAAAAAKVAANKSDKELPQVSTSKSGG